MSRCVGGSAGMGDGKKDTPIGYNRIAVAMIPRPPHTVEILSGGRRFSLREVTFIDFGAGQWQIEFSVASQEAPITLIDIVRAGGGALMLSIDGGPVVGAHTRVRPLYQTILSQPMRYEFAWP